MNREKDTQKHSRFIIAAESEKTATEIAVKTAASRTEISPVAVGRFAVRGLRMSNFRSAILLKPIAADLAGFEVPDEFVVGYGLDYAQKYRNMPYIGVLKPEVYSEN